ncbi:CaaX farnesyltransferase alpha subunit [Trichophyton interdigitale]|uniref:Protein farnesyltransferase/geranylgeranyltransferase type-1 subunit alpha n=1 Tax=Trichophyton interdigitale TaxID=101480 RepID=A0A9P4YEF2_9EURO|nr:CaaX farnesyltransferase alpha subunit [Trichophyton interdigitale]KAF3895184.1 CaaX farnesyltransferase alpha subunit [Trichophyton interdigitale]KAG8208193.1 CaaX farnesyltransferase alpha subunit [Trichophyton interdigitale]
MSKYSSDPAWASVTPIPLDDGSNRFTQADRENAAGDDAVTTANVANEALPLATIAYSDSYSEATAYLRAVMAANEMSDRALALTEDVIRSNPAHYTVWLYRAQILNALGKDLKAELAWLDQLSTQYLKSYQIWHHRQVVMSNESVFPALPEGELEFLAKMFALDSKNYHVWTYRHWLLRHFKLWDSPAELADIERMIDEDVMNNSAWNHRWIMRFAPREGFESGLPGVGIPGGVGGAGAGKMVVVDEEMVDGEVEYAKKKIVLAPENRSPWAYLRGVLKAADRSLADLKGFAERFVVKEVVEEGQGEFLVKSSHALEWLGDVYAEQAHDAEAKNSAVQMFTLLKGKYDPIRKNYWEYRIRSMDK